MRARTHATAPVVSVLVLVALLLGACSSSSKWLDTKALEARLLKGIQDQTNIELSDVVCPRKVKIEKGNTFECTATATSGHTAQVSVTQANDRGDVDWKIAAPGG